MIYYTGDIHGQKYEIVRFCKRFNLTGEDTVVILGDVAANYYGNGRDNDLKDAFKSLKPTILCIHGNHEMRPTSISTYKEKEAFIREALEMKVNNIFEQMYHGHRRVSIDQKYQVTLLTTIEDKEVAAGESEGSNRVKSFAFIAGLVALAKEKLIANAGEEGFNLSSEPYPLVMDAPFSNADETHTANISKVLPEIAEQVIMFVMQKDWRYAEPVMATRVGKQYELKKLSETHTVLQ